MSELESKSMPDTTLPTWEECETKRQQGSELTHLEQFILRQEPSGEYAIEFREELAAVFTELARDAKMNEPLRGFADIRAHQMDLAANALERYNSPTLSEACRRTAELLRQLSGAKSQVVEGTTSSTQTLFDDVGQFHNQLDLPHLGDGLEPRLLSTQDFRYRIACIDEEKRELIEAHARGDLADFADALGDIVWFVLGTAQLAHVPFNEIWREIKRANLEKRRWVEGDPMKPRNTTIEVTKLPGWKAPDIRTVLLDHVAQLRVNNK